MPMPYNTVVLSMSTVGAQLEKHFVPKLGRGKEKEGEGKGIKPLKGQTESRKNEKRVGMRLKKTERFFHHIHYSSHTHI